MKRDVLPDGAVEITITLTPHEAAQLSGDELPMLSKLGRALWAIVDLRAGRTRDEWWPVVMDVSQLMKWLSGVRDAAIRESPADTSHGVLAGWLGLSRSTVQSRRAAGTLPPAEQNAEERWARTGNWSDLLEAHREQRREH